MTQGEGPARGAEAAPPAAPVPPARGMSAWALRVAQWPMATRIALLVLIPMLLLVCAGGSWLRGQMHRSLMDSFEQVLRDKAQRVGARLQLGPGGTLREAAGGADEFSAIYAGWYWRAEAGREVLRSRSLWDMDRLPTDDRPAAGSAVLHPATGPRQEPLLALTVPVALGQPAAAVALTVFGPAEQLQSSVRQIDRNLVLAGSVLLALAGVLAWLQVRVGLAPLRRLEALLATLREPQGAGAGVAEHLAAPTGRDLQPLQNELAGLLAHNAHVVARARAHAVDLNHALKKPLALLNAQASAQPQVASSEVRRQVEAMAQLVDRYQGRTLSDALHAHPGAGASAVDVRECVAQVLRMMQRLHAAQELDWTLEDRATGPVRWRGERADLEEVLGNLLDNAGKWAASRVRLTLSAEPAAGLGRLELDVEDDGPGMTPEQLQAAGQRGVRFDESIQGSGLGLAITGQIAQAYGGRLALYHSADLRGLGVRLEMRGLIPPGAGAR
ncbi:sensor histidine kinase [Paracidovorax citrulli]|nr:sensor histidine kinase [Paracidovorax citrulli]PVY63767.1 signal transduction histidine kinase [Paracidovorax citrulli]QCX09744.1 Sensor protein PhoQ [Paracidovorax citrulli]REG67269.1 signal transduction histidine kinase [Paracidovorax citrulli]RLJ91829.1 signal transduction histidine kinase [Paracidovorax citrulli]UEG47260.1 sensor histidine kinase [Paracidovorax citrulli]